MHGSLRRYLLREGASVVGFARVGEALTEEISHLDRAVSIGVARRLNEDTLALLTELRLKAERFLRDRGYRFLSFPADSDRINGTFVSRLYGLFSHKAAATCAGLGWVGRNGLLISPGFGPRLSLATVLTNAPLKAGEPIGESLCGDCYLCVEHCPSGAISGEDWSRRDPFPGLTDFTKCRSYKENSRELNGRPNCGLCINICPYGRKGTAGGGRGGRGGRGRKYNIGKGGLNRMSVKHKVIFQPSGRRGEVEEGTTLLEGAQSLGVDLEAVCGGKGTCGKCKVRVEEGFFEKDAIESSMEHLSPLSEAEQKFIKPEDGPNIRLACSTELRGDIKLFVPEKSRAGKQIVRKAAREITVPLEPAVRKYFIELQKPTLHDLSKGDSERLLGALDSEYGLTGLRVDFTVLPTLQDTLREGGWRATVSVWMDREVIKVEPGYVEAVYGLAVDVGTTTVAAYLSEMGTGKVVATESMMNPQVPYGEDVMSRITYAMTNDDGLKTMQDAIIKCVNELIDMVTANIATGNSNATGDSDATDEEGEDGGNGKEDPPKRAAGEDIVDMTVVFNTAMHHIFLGLNPVYIGRSPFIPAFQNDVDIKARDLGIKINRASYVHVLPLEAGFVGADNVGVLIAEEPYNQDEKVLIIDIGTNGELLLGNRERINSTSCATGPAFEGAQIKFGMRAAPGAIETVRIDPKSTEPRYKVIGKADWHTHIEKVEAKGICGSGIIDVIAEMFKAGVIDKSGRFVSGLSTPRVRKGAGEKGKPEYVLAWADETSIGTDITVTQGDVRALQLAKGALYAGAKLMMKRMGIESLDRVILAGAFGSYIDKRSALTLGMFPDCDIEKIYAVGNAAGDGALMALLNTGKRKEARQRARWLEYVEIAVEPEFEKEFMRAMHFPHMKDEFPNLKRMLEAEETPDTVRG